MEIDMQIFAAAQSIAIQKPEGTSVTYHIFPEYEIHYNELAPGTIQQWHHHTAIEEVLFVIAGDIEAHWLKNGTKLVAILHPGDIARVEDTPHTFINSSGSVVTFLVVRLILDGTDKRERIKNDKQLDQIV